MRFFPLLNIDYAMILLRGKNVQVLFKRVDRKQ